MTESEAITLAGELAFSTGHRPQTAGDSLISLQAFIDFVESNLAGHNGLVARRDRLTEMLDTGAPRLQLAKEALATLTS